MATAQIKDTNIRLLYDGGVDAYGKPVVKAKSYNNIHPEAETDQIYAVATAIASLCNHPLLSVERTDKSEIVE